MKRRRGKKKRSMIRHAYHRLKQRYGLTMSRALHAEIVECIQKGNAEVLEKQSNRVSLFMVEVRNTEIKIVYDKIRKQVITVLPQDDPWEE